MSISKKNPWLTLKQFREAMKRVVYGDFRSLTKEQFKKKLYTEFKISKDKKAFLEAEFDNPLNDLFNDTQIRKYNKRK